MKSFFLGACSLLLFGFSAAAQESPINLWNWKLELPSGYKASDWKLSNYQKDRFAKPFFHLDTLDSAIVMEAYPSEGTSKSKYTRNTLREQMQAGSNDVNWTMKEGAVLEADFQVTQMSKGENGKYHRTILFQIDGRTTEKQTEKLGLKKPKSMPMVKIYWQNERLRVTRKVLKDESMVGDDLLLKSSWKETESTIYAKEKVGFEKVHIRIEVKKGKITIQVNEEKPIVFRDLSVSQWYFENYFTVGNYLQSKEAGCHSTVKFYSLVVSHGK
ncbi:MAG: polysaccharide lyase family 7 protein [Salibacteraceae bacterium]